MTVWMRYRLIPRGQVSAAKGGEVSNNKGIHLTLPGSVVRGALGTQWWRHHDAERADEFHTLFGRDMVVGPAIPVRDGQAAQLFPLSWRYCKHPSEGCQPWDSLAEDRYDCRCGSAPTAHYGWKKAADWVIETTRTELEGGVAKNEQLFTRRAFGRDVEFEGIVAVADATQAAWLTSVETVSVGGQLSVMGRCSWSCEQIKDPLPIPQKPGTYAMVLLTPAILINRYGANTLDLAGAVQDIIRDGTQVGRQFTRPETVTGWHGLAGIPKPTEWACMAGSVLELINADPSALQRLKDGVGVRRTEGFGMVAIVPPGTLPRIVTERDTSAAQPKQPTATRHPIFDIVDRFPAEDRDRIRNALLDAVRELEPKSKTPMQKMRLGDEARKILDRPWAKGLAGSLRDDIVTALTSHLDGARTALEAQ